MGITSLRQLLKSLCHNSPWEYSVFWKLKHRSRMLLTWEDGYCNYPRRGESIQGVADNLSFSETNGVASFDCEISTSNGLSAAHPIGLAVASMSCLLYSLGEGFVGKVASTGKHCWIVSDEIKSNLLSEYPDEWQLQFAVGIKTILLVPVVPHGVVQLGSLEKITEDHTLMAHIKDMFNTLHYIPMESVSSASGSDHPHPLLSTPTSLLLDVERIVEQSSNANNMLDQNLSEPEEKDPMALDGIQKARSILSTIDQDNTSRFIGQDDLWAQGKIVDDARDAEFSALLMGQTAISFAQNQISNESSLMMMEPDIPDFYSIEEDLQFSSQSNFSEVRCATLNNLCKNFCPSSDMIEKALEDDTNYEIYQKRFHGFLNFPADSELHKALLPAFHNRCTESKPIVLGEDVSRNSTLMYHTDYAREIESIEESNGWFIGGGDAGNLLNTVISDSFDTSGDIASDRSNSVKSPITSLGWFSAPCETKSQSECHALGADHSGPWSSARSVFVSQLGSGTSLKNTITNMTDDEQQKKGPGRQSRKGTKLSHCSQKKGRHGDVQRPKPRPRDRQMIQDRVKELRELVPNGAKCSIDALLDQTIKHMLFLRSVTNRAEKLKKCVYPGVTGINSSKLSETWEHQKGASWAFELGSEFGVCPIVVKDLDQLGHMVIEMLCEEHGLFLEIAQVICQLNLTVLKGVLESRSDKTWAYFVVEASAGFQRMDIFWPLMRLLQRSSPMSSMF